MTSRWPCSLFTPFILLWLLSSVEMFPHSLSIYISPPPSRARSVICLHGTTLNRRGFVSTIGVAVPFLTFPTSSLAVRPKKSKLPPPISPLSFEELSLQSISSELNLLKTLPAFYTNSALSSIASQLVAIKDIQRAELSSELEKVRVGLNEENCVWCCKEFAHH